MSTQPIRDINLLEDPFRTKVKRFLAHMAAIGEPMQAHETLRTQERQDFLLKQGGKTWVKRSKHQDGLAVDLHFITYPHFPPTEDIIWDKAADIAKRFGINNGKVMWGIDANHFEDDGTPLHKEPQKNKTKIQKIKDFLFKRFLKQIIK